jgi:ribonuclease HI
VVSKKPFEIIIFTDGSARGNPGPGGYGVVLISGSNRKELSDGYALTTNNRMELLAVITGLEALKFEDSRVTVYTDSKYVSDAIEKGWLFKWEKERFKKKKNVDLWLRFLKIYRKHDIKFIWIKGHADNKENEHCDKLAVGASYNQNLKEDAGYVTEINSVSEID